MGLSLKKLAGPVGATIGYVFGGPAGAATGYEIGNYAGSSGLLGGNDDEMSAMDIYKMQRADALADWDRQNAYNDPSAQMQRLIKANLNPYLVYSGSNVTGNSSSGIDQVTYKPYTVDNGSSSLTRLIQNLNLRSLKADTKGKEIDTEMRNLDLQLKKARLASLISGQRGGNKTKELSPYQLRRQEDVIENANRRSYNESFWGRMPFFGSFLAESAYSTDKKYREGLANKYGKKTWEIEPRHYFGF